MYAADNTNNSLPLLENEDIWWWENAIGNARTDPNLAKEVVLIYMGALEEKFPRYEILCKYPRGLTWKREMLFTVPDPDLEIRAPRSSRPLDKGERGLQKTFSALRASVWSKNKGGPGPSGTLPRIRHCFS